MNQATFQKAHIHIGPLPNESICSGLLRINQYNFPVDLENGYTYTTIYAILSDTKKLIKKYILKTTDITLIELLDEPFVLID